MRGSLCIIAFFIMGIVLAHLDLVPKWLLEHDPALGALWLLMALVGLSLGSDRKLAEILRSVRVNVLLLPCATTVGTFIGASLAACFLTFSLADCLAVGSGFAYYSLSSIFITRYKGPDIGTVALVSNIIRELLTLLLTPLIVRFFGTPSAISCGGASTMDTTLPIITRYGGTYWIIPSIIHAVVLDFSVPFWVTLFCSW